MIYGSLATLIASELVRSNMKLFLYVKTPLHAQSQDGQNQTQITQPNSMCQQALESHKKLAVGQTPPNISLYVSTQSVKAQEFFKYGGKRLCICTKARQV